VREQPLLDEPDGVLRAVKVTVREMLGAAPDGAFMNQFYPQTRQRDYDILFLEMPSCLESELELGR